MPEIEVRAHVGAEGGVVKYQVLKWVLYVQYIPTHVPHVVFHVEMFILPYGDLLWLKHWIKTVAPLLHFVFAFVSLKPLLRLW